MNKWRNLHSIAEKRGLILSSKRHGKLQEALQEDIKFMEDLLKEKPE